MSKRQDIHRPSVIKPEDYSFVAIIPHGEGLDVAMIAAGERQRLREHMAHTGGKFSQHAHGGSCHICGAGAMTLAYFQHVPSNQYIVTGQDCCEKLDSGHAGMFKKIRDEATALREAKAGKLKAVATLKEAGLEKCWDIFEANGLFEAQDLGWEEGVIWDIVQKLVRYGSISEKQEAFLKKLLIKMEGREELKAKRDAETEAAAPVPKSDKRMTVVGKVLTTKVQESQYGDTLKMLVQHADGWKVWGSVPSSLNEYDYEKEEAVLKKGSEVQFDAKVEVSDDDPKFGFFSRPTKAKIVQEA